MGNTQPDIQKKYKMGITENMEIKGVLGQGSYGVVQKVIDKSNKKELALKTVFIDEMNENTKKEAWNEINILAQCSHPHIIKLIGYEEHKNKMSYLMDLMKCSLEDYFKSFQTQNKDPPKEFILDILYQIVGALAYLLKNFSISHRDIKPQNILLDNENKARLSDFGSIKQLSGGNARTRVGTIVGTSLFIAPELAKAMGDHMEGKIDEYKAKVNFSKTDTFSLGMTILRGIAPTQFFKYQTLLNTNEETLINVLVEIKEKIPIEIYDILFLMLSYNTNIRPDILKLWNMLNTRSYYEKKDSLEKSDNSEKDELKKQIISLKEEIKQKNSEIEELKKGKGIEGKKSFVVEAIDNSQRILAEKLAIFDSVKGSDQINKESEITADDMKMFENSLRQSSKRGVSVKSVRLNLEQKMAKNDKNLANIAENLAKMPDLSNLKLNLSNNNLGINGIKILCSNLEKMTKINNLQLFLDNNEIPEEGIILLSKSIKSMPSLLRLKLFLAKNTMGENGLKVLCESIPIQLDLLQFDLELNNIGELGAKLIGDLLKKMNNLSQLFLFLRGNSLGDNGTKKLFEGMKKISTKILHIYLEKNFISDPALKAFQECLKKNANINFFHLSLRGNYIGDIGLKTILETLKTLTNLNTLEFDLSENIVTDDGVKLLCEYLPSITSLVTLKIFFSGNKLTNSGNELLMTLKDLNNKKIKTEVYA